MNLFVYGTLKKGGKYHYYLEGASRISSEATAEGTLYDTGFDYPAMTLEGKSTVAGELYKVPEHLWPGIDELEDCTGKPDDLYRKVTVEIRSEGGRQEAITYVAKDGRLLQTLIESGNWEL